MLDSDQQDKKQDANLEDEAQIDLKVNKDRSDNRISKIATMDNGTMVEAFKFLNYCQLAKSSRVSKRFWNLIRTHRHSLALLYVDSICMKQMISGLSGIKMLNMFGKELLPEAYNEWVISNHYSKQIPLEWHGTGRESMNQRRRVYELKAEADYKDSKLCRTNTGTTVFLTSAEFSYENWPLFQHFVRLLMDPFIYIRTLELTPQIEVSNLLAAANYPENLDSLQSLQCEVLNFSLDCNIQKLISWVKDHVQCDKFQIYDHRHYTICDEELLLEALADFFLTGAHCTSEINFKYYEPTKVIIAFVPKFMGLKSCDEYQIVESIECNILGVSDLNELVFEYPQFIVKEWEDNHRTEYVFEFINNDIGKKLQLTAKILGSHRFVSCFDVKINNL
ncbi:hypothetical protein Ddc_16537 [Ditylenchus destructor]|nr:hypothetical protein Ddc_16537 [Ditylenchus destructor]